MIYQPTDYPKTWEEFEERCLERIDRVRESGDQGHFANIYAADVEMLLLVMRESHQDYDGNPMVAYQWIMERLAKKPEPTDCSGVPTPGSQPK